MKNITTVKAQIEKISGVESANVWEKHGKCRIYIELPKLNGGKNWNGGRAGNVLYDSAENKIIYAANDWAGAATRNNAMEILNAIESATGISSRPL